MICTVSLKLFRKKNEKKLKVCNYLTQNKRENELGIKFLNHLKSVCCIY